MLRNKLSKNCSNSEKNIKKVNIEGVTNKKIFGEKTLYDRWEDSVDNPNNVYHNYYNFLGTSDEWRLHVAYYKYIKLSFYGDIAYYFNNYYLINDISGGKKNTIKKIKYNRKKTKKTYKKQ